MVVEAVVTDHDLFYVNPHQREIDAVVEEHRQKIGATKMHVTAAPGATPEDVRRELRLVDEALAEYYALPLVTRMKAHIQQLEDKLHQASKLGQCRIDEMLDETPRERKLRKALFNLGDIIGVDTGYAIEYAKKPQKPSQWDR